MSGAAQRPGRLTLELNHWECRLLLQACPALHKTWLASAHAAEDEDLQADYSNDLGQLGILDRRLKQEVAAAFGAGGYEPNP